MNKYLKFILGIIGISGIIGLSFFGYQKLNDYYKPQQISIIGEEEKSGTEESSDVEEKNSDNNQNVSETESETEDNQDSQNNQHNNKKEPVKAFDFTVVDIDGNEVSLSSMVGTPVIVNFWASWCGPCKSEMPEFQKLYEEYGEDIKFMMVNLTDGERETKKVAQNYIDSEGYTFPVYFDVNQDAAYTYQIFSIPTTYFIDAEGYFVASSQGAMDEETLRKGIGLIYPEQ